MKTLPPLLFVLVLFTQIGLKLGIGTWFIINQSEIIEQFCINKENEALQCNGKCHLNKQIALIENHDTEQENNSEEQSNKVPTVQEFIETSSDCNPFLIKISSSKQKTYYRINYYEHPYLFIEKAPPQYIA